MSLPDPYASVIKKSFSKSMAGTSSKEKKEALKEMMDHLLGMDDPGVAAQTLANDLGDTKSAFSKKIDIKTGIGSLFSSASATRTEMTDLSNKLDSFLSDSNLGVIKTQLKDTVGKGLGSIFNTPGSKDPLRQAYDIDSVKQLEIDQTIKESEAKRLISHGDITNIFNKGGLDYKGQANYASLTLMNGGGLQFNTDFAALFFPPAAAAGLKLSASASVSGLKGVQRFVYAEVCNGNNGGWQLPSGEAIKKTLCTQVISNLKKVDASYFDTDSINNHLLGSLDADDFNSVDKVLETLLRVPLGKADADGLEGEATQAKYLRFRDEVPYASPELERAVSHACEATESLLTKIPSERDRYNKLIVAGCMQSVAWEWRAGVGANATFSPLNIESIKNVADKIKSSAKWFSSEPEYLQYVTLGISCSLTAEGNLSASRRSFYATDKNARIFASGDDDFSKNVSQTFNNYISNAIRFSTEQSLKDYVRYRLSVLVDKNFSGRSFCNPLQIEQYKKHFDPGSLQGLINKVSAPSLTDIRKLCESMKGNAEILMNKVYTGHRAELVAIDRQIDAMCTLLEEFENQEEAPDLGRFTLCYTGTVGTATAKAGGQASISLTGIANAKASASILSALKASHRANYLLQTPLVKTDRFSGKLPDFIRGALGAAHGAANIRTICAGELPDSSTAGPLLTKTQETTVWYRQTSFEAIEELKASGKFVGLTAQKSSIPTVGGVAPPKSPYFNNIEYHTATAVWFPDGDQLRLTDGSGRSYGQTMLLEELLALAKSLVRIGPLPEETQGKLDILARSIHTTPEKLREFFKGTQFLKELDYLAPQNWVNQKGAVLIEAIHALSLRGSPCLKKKKVNLADKLKRTANGINNVPESPLESEAMPDVDPRTGTYSLQSIRIRYRMADVADGSSDSTLFTLGIPKATGLSLGVTLSEVDVAGASGVVDILTYWFSGTRASESLLNVGTAGSVIYNRADSVQATVLITQ
jgi:hypothetical protein